MGDKELLYTLFSYEYGKIKANKKYNKAEKNLDIGYIINSEIITCEKTSIHKIRNIKIKSEFRAEEKKSFILINKYLEILSLIYRELPEGLSNKEIFCLVELLNNSPSINYNKLLLAYLKTKSLLGDLTTNHDNKDIEEILKKISYNKGENVLNMELSEIDVKILDGLLNNNL